MKEIKLTKKNIAIVDDEDYEYLSQFKWSSNHGYATRNITINGIQKTIRMHRLIANPPDGMQVDHINGNRSDNRKENLRVCTNAQNIRNAPKQKNNKCGFKGVSIKYRKNKKYQYIVAQIHSGKKNIHLGIFNTKEEAALAYNKAATKYHGEFAKLNIL